MNFLGILALWIWLSKQNNPYWTYYNKKIGSLAVNSYNSKMLKTNCFIYKSFNFYYSLPTQFSLGFDCVHNTKTTYEFPIQASKLISKNTNSSKYYSYNFRIFFNKCKLSQKLTLWRIKGWQKISKLNQQTKTQQICKLSQAK